MGKIKTWKGTINSQNIEIARKNFMKYGGNDKVIVKIKLLHKKNTPKNKSLYNMYEVTYKSRKNERTYRNYMRSHPRE